MNQTTLMLIIYFIFFYYLLRYFLFFFSSRRRHTRSKRDWSSDVCSSDLQALKRSSARRALPVRRNQGMVARTDRSEERRVGKSVDLGGRRIIKKKKKKKNMRIEKKKIKKRKVCREEMREM